MHTLPPPRNAPMIDLTAHLDLPHGSLPNTTLKFSKFFTALANRIFRSGSKDPSAKPDPFQKRNIMRDLLADADLRAIAQEAGNARRLEAHRVSCLGAYDYKHQLVKTGKGHHTLAGIPAGL